jgi:hypothetical protein
MSEFHERIKLLTRAALDDAYKLQVASLYKIWLSQPGDQAARQRAGVGMHNAIRAYREAIASLDAWEESE